jgi:hypothetical protein
LLMREMLLIPALVGLAFMKNEEQSLGRGDQSTKACQASTMPPNNVPVKLRAARDVAPGTEERLCIQRHTNQTRAPAKRQK